MAECERRETRIGNTRRYRCDAIFSGDGHIAAAQAEVAKLLLRGMLPELVEFNGCTLVRHIENRATGPERYDYGGQALTLPEIASRKGMKVESLYWRINRWGLSEALRAPKATAVERRAKFRRLYYGEAQRLLSPT